MRRETKVGLRLITLGAHAYYPRCTRIGGSVAKLLLQYPDQYRVRALTRNTESDAAQSLARLGAELVKADLTVPAEVNAALQGCWGVFGVTNFYDSVRCSLRPLHFTAEWYASRRSKTTLGAKSNKERISSTLL